jgi:hypothetical protein
MINMVPMKYLVRDDQVGGDPIWMITKCFNGGKHLPSLIQVIGDCVSFGCVHVVNYTSAFEIAWLGQEEQWHCGFPPYVYGMSRCAPDLGNGQLGNGDGSLGSWGAGALKKYGTLFADDANVPPYSGTVAKQWGYRGVPSEFQGTAANNLLDGITMVRGVDAIRDALKHYKPCTFAWMWDLADRPTKVSRGGKDFGVLRRTSVLGGHQIALLAWDDDLPGALIQNSWPHSLYTGFQFNGEPDGSAWVTAEDLEAITRYGDDYECYASTLFHGEPGDPDWTPGVVASPVHPEYPG